MTAETDSQRTAREPAPGFIEPGIAIEENVLNIDIAPTFLEIAGTEMPHRETVDGLSLLSLLGRGRGRAPGWRSTLIHQYYWEDAFPHTPTTYAIRTDQYKYIYYHGIWDRNELYDLRTDANEMHNLIDVPAHRAQRESLHTELFDFLETNGVTNVLFRPPAIGGFERRERKIHDR